MRWLCALAFLALVSPIAFSNTIWVPDDYPTIQQAIDAAVDGDEVTVRPGTYFENIFIWKKAITLKSEYGPEVTVIDGSYGSQCGEGACINLYSRADCIVEGFTITKGVGNGSGQNCWSAGGGIFCAYSSPTICNNIIIFNEAVTSGGGIHCEGGNPIIIGNAIVGNSTLSWGGGISTYPSTGALHTSVTIKDNLIVGNEAYQGGGIYVEPRAEASVSGNTFVGNRAAAGGGISCVGDATLENNILWGNSAATGPEICVGGTLTSRYSNVMGGLSSVHVEPGSKLKWGPGMIDADPLFFDGRNNDYRLRQNPPQSGAVNPCVDAGDPSSPMVAGTTRTDWVQDTGVVDMGYHYPVTGGGVGTVYCFGDWTGTACACGNAGGPGEGCANSTGAGGIVLAGGSTSVLTDDLVFHAAHLIPGTPGMLIVGDQTVNGGSGIVFGDGLRCVGGSVVRIGVEVPDAYGQASWGPGLSAQGGWQAGDTRRFQIWYRDPAGPCGSSFNLTNAVEITLTP